MANDLTIKFNGLTYIYNLFKINSKPTQRTEGSTLLHNITPSNVVSLFDFLEIPKEKASYPITVNGKEMTLVVNTSPASGLYWQATFTYGGRNYLTISAETDEILGNLILGGTALGYDYAQKRYLTLEGASKFTPTVDKQWRGAKTEYTHSYSLPAFINVSELKQGVEYDAVFSSTPFADFITAICGTSTALDSFFNFIGNLDFPTYPDNDDDPEKDDDDPTDPTPSPGDDSSDPIPIPPKPVVDVTGTGFVTLYNPSALDIRQLAYFMWSGDFVDLLKKMFAAPFDCLIGLKLLYAPLTTGATQNIWLGNIESTVSAPKITDQFTDFDCGSIQLAGYFNSFLDYSPCTRVTIFLPFIGYKELNVDEVMNATLHLVYRIDAYSGSCIAFLTVTKNIGNTALNSVLYEFDGNAAMDIPFTSGDMSRYVAAVLGTAASTAGAVVSMGAGARLATASVSQGSSDPWSKNPMEKKTVTGLSDLGNGSVEWSSGKPNIQRGGSLAGANASMALKQPYVIIERPIQQMPSDYPNFIGIPLNMSKPLSSFSGFTVVSQVFMASSSATDDELNMIDSLLRQGVII